MSASPDESLRKSLDFYHSASQLRFDTWHRLEHYTTQLSHRSSRKAEVTQFKKAAREAFSILETIEYYTAFPSRDDFNTLVKFFEREDYTTLSRMVERLVRAITTHTYQRSTFSSIQRLSSGETTDEAEEDLQDLDLAQQKPYFEVLFVDEMSDAEEERDCAPVCAKCAARKTSFTTKS